MALLQTLELGLSGAYTLFHSVDWSRGVGEHEQHGEIDIVVVNQAGDVLLIEVKSGPVDFASGGIFKTYGSHSKSVTGQIGLQYDALRGRLHDAGLGVALHHLLVLPDVQVQSESAQWPREHIVDSGEIGHISVRGVVRNVSTDLCQFKLKIVNFDQLLVARFLFNRNAWVPNLPLLFPPGNSADWT